jgi:hypothetical protein
MDKKKVKRRQKDRLNEALELIQELEKEIQYLRSALVNADFKLKNKQD